MGREYEVVFDQVRLIVEARDEEEAVEYAKEKVDDIALSYDGVNVV